MPQTHTLRPLLHSLGLVALMVAVSVGAIGQPSALEECSHAFYRGDYVRVAQLAEKHLRKYPNDAPMRVMLARAELAQRKFQPAVTELERVLVSDPHNVDALFYLSFAASELSRMEYQKLFALAPDSGRVHQLLAEAALAAQNPTEAETEFQNALKANPRSIEVATELAELKRSQSKFDEAITYYTKAEGIGPLNYEIAYGLGACYTYKQEYSRAAEWLRKAVDLAPDSVAGRFALGNVLFQSGQLEAAIPELQTSLKLEPRMKQAYFLLGRAYSKLGRQDEAKAAFKKLDELSHSEIPGQEKESTGNLNSKPDMSQ